MTSNIQWTSWAWDKKSKIELDNIFAIMKDFFNHSKLIKMELSIAVTIDICFWNSNFFCN